MNIPRNEYPRPQFERDEWINLNGCWSYAFDFNRSGDAKQWHKSSGFKDQIIVPFCPESSLSQVKYTDFIGQMWYQRKISIPSSWQNRLILLHFGGVDYECAVYIDGNEVGRHTGGASPFSLEITRHVTAGKEHDLVVMVKDDLRSGLQPRGKQCSFLNSCGCSYTRVTGIWQTVWMEAVAFSALKSCRILPNYDDGTFTFIPEFHRCPDGGKLQITILDNGKPAVSGKISAGNGHALTLTLPEPKEWNPETPFLYDVEYTLFDRSGRKTDKVRSYAGLRKIDQKEGRFYLNNRPIYLRFVLDQGFYEDGIWTAPDDAALRRDIELSMKAGFNGARLHQKVFDERFYYWADRLGYLTWAEFPDWGISFWQHFGTVNPDYCRSFRDYFAEWSAVVQRDINHPSIIAWTPFNETSNYADAEEHKRILSDIYDLTRRLDPTRPVNDSSGYCHAKTDIWSIHTYAQSAETLAEIVDTEPIYMTLPELEMPAWDGQPYIVDEYGGIRCSTAGEKPSGWGYNKEELTPAQCEERMIGLTAFLVNNPRVTGYCYTQLTDIEQEQNGIYDYGRNEKFDMANVRKCFTLKPGWSKW